MASAIFLFVVFPTDIADLIRQHLTGEGGLGGTAVPAPRPTHRRSSSPSCRGPLCPGDSKTPPTQSIAAFLVAQGGIGTHIAPRVAPCPKPVQERAQGKDWRPGAAGLHPLPAGSIRRSVCPRRCGTKASDSL